MIDIVNYFNPISNVITKNEKLFEKYKTLNKYKTKKEITIN